MNETDTRCYECASEDLSITAADGRVWCSRECREATRGADRYEQATVRRNTTTCPRCGDWRVSHSDGTDASGRVGCRGPILGYCKARCALTPEGVDIAVARLQMFEEAQRSAPCPCTWRAA